MLYSLGLSSDLIIELLKLAAKHKRFHSISLFYNTVQRTFEVLIQFLFFWDYSRVSHISNNSSITGLVFTLGLYFIFGVQNTYADGETGTEMA